ncbi:MAG: M1 family metallopeptidase [Gemmatimonadetes bacterium]|nr:M1 family metallopeptidase [Gemmatimonadota bacterium]
MRTRSFHLATAAIVIAVPVMGQTAQRAYHPGVDVLDYEMSLDLPQTGNAIDARAVLTLRRTAPVDTLRLDLLSLRVDSVLVNQGAVRFVRDSSTVRVPLPAGSGDTIKVAVRYGGPVADGLIIRTDSAWGWTAFGDNWPDRGRHWIPSVDHPSDKATVTWIVRAPSQRKVIANGTRLEETPIAGSNPAGTLTRWRMAEPIPVYLMVIAAAPLYEYDLGETACGLSLVNRCVHQWAYVEPGVKDFMPGPFKRAGDIVAFFASLVGPFPYEKLAHLESSTRFGGMENATAIFYADRPFRRRTMTDGVVAHETAHQWFGDAVTETEWAHLWLSEGFATYFEALWTRKSAGDSAFREEMRRIRDEITSDQRVARLPVIDTVETDLLSLLDANSYQKGGFVLHMLRSTLGDSTFFRGLRSYYNKYRNGNALSDDLRRELEAASGQQLGWFFDQWLTRPGFPELATDWTYDPTTRRITLEITQGSRFGAYRFPLEVAIQTATGEQVRTRVEVPAQTSVRLTLDPPLGGTPPGLVLDPDVKLLATYIGR